MGLVVVLLIVALSVLPSTTVTAEERILTPEEMDVEYVRLWNENKFDELVDFYYADNALFMPPNEEPIRGKQNILERLKQIRQVFGEFQTGLQPLQVVETEGMTSIVGNFAFLDGGIRIVTHETFQRETDGSWKVIVDMPGFRDPQGTSATCRFTFPNRLSPGFTLTSSTGTYGSGGETGTITCLGSLDGHRVTGPGTFGFEGVYTGDCFGNTGSGTYSFTVPTEVGAKQFAGSYSEHRTGFNGPIQASQPGGSFQGTFLVQPQKGDCLTSPVTEVVVNMAGTFAQGSVTPERRTSPSL